MFFSRPPGTCALMECKFCGEITHPTCVTDYGVDGFIRMDLPNFWECPRCIKNRKESGESEAGPSPEKMIKKEDPDEKVYLIQIEQKSMTSSTFFNFSHKTSVYNFKWFGNKLSR